MEGKRMNWRSTEYNKGVSLYPFGVNGFYFDAPGSDGHINCVFSERSEYGMRKNIVIRYYVHTISGSPKFTGFGKKVAGGLAPNFRPMLTSGGILDDRWYPSGIDCGFLSVFDHVFTLSIPLAPQHWQDASGHPATNDPARFKKVVTHSGGIGIVFGWQNYFAHGLYVMNGKARFGLWDYKIT
jgi:hypothetical protein